MTASGHQPIPQALAEALRAAESVAVLTGAGISAESGIPTFRDALKGLWAKHDPLQLATPEAFLRDPELVWDWYRSRRQTVLECHPNPAHQALAALAGQCREMTLVTQNVDGLHQRAGSTDVIEYHGNLFATRCFVEDVELPEVDDDHGVPRCPTCGGLARPGVVWFGEAIPARAHEAATHAAANADLFLSIGTSSQVWPAAGLAEEANSGGAVTVEINTDSTSMSDIFDYRLTGKAGELLPRLLDSLFQ